MCNFTVKVLIFTSCFMDFNSVFHSGHWAKLLFVISTFLTNIGLSCNRKITLIDTLKIKIIHIVISVP